MRISDWSSDVCSSDLDDGTSWSVGVPVDSAWREPVLPLSAFTVSRGVLLPQGFPGQWNYWVGPAAGRGGNTDRPRLERPERRPEERRVGKEGVRTGRSRGSPDH